MRRGRWIKRVKGGRFGLEQSVEEEGRSVAGGLNLKSVVDVDWSKVWWKRGEAGHVD